MAEILSKARQRVRAELAVLRANVRQRGRLGLALIPAGVVAAKVLGTPDVKATTASGTILDAVLIGASLATLAGLVTVVLPFSFARIGLTIASATGATVSLFVAGVAALALTRSVHLDSVLWGAICTFGFMGAAIVLSKAGRYWGWKRPNLAKGAPSLLAPAVILSALGLWHQTAYTPASLEATVSVAPEFVFEGPSSDSLANRGSVTVLFTNEGGTGTRVIISVLLICPRPTIESLAGADVQDPHCLRVPRPLAEGAVVESGGSLVNRQVFTLQNNAQLVESLTRFAYARADKLRYGDAVDDILPSCIDQAYELLPPSRYQALLSDERIIVYGPGAHGGYTYSITNREDPECPTNRDDSLLDEYGIREVSIAVDEWIDVADSPSVVSQTTNGPWTRR